MMKLTLCLTAIFPLVAFGLNEEYKPHEKTSVFVEAFVKLPGEATQKNPRVYAIDQKTNKLYIVHLKKMKDGSYTSQFDLKNKPFAELPVFIFGADEKVTKKLIVVVKDEKQFQRIALFDNEMKSMLYTEDPDNKVKMDKSDVQEWLRKRSQLIEKNRLEVETEFVLSREKKKKEFESLPAKVQSQREAEAAVLARKAEEAYRSEKDAEAVELFKNSVTLDPRQDKVYYKYGVALYKTNDYVHSLAALASAEGDVQNKAEYYYYIGLNNMKLKDMEKAYDSFRIARDENDPGVSPMAAFLGGNIAFQTEKYDAAKEDFQFILDNSQDVAMDKQAEKMLEQIDQIEAYIASTKQVFRYSIFAGYSYDQNILNISQAQGTPTDNAGYRLNYGVTGYYKIRQTTTSELGLQASYSDTYSTDTSNNATTALQASDPLLLNVGVPYRMNFQAYEKPMVWSITPSLSTVTMNAESKGRQKILESKTVDSDVMIQVSPQVISAYRVQLNMDEAFLSSNGGENDQGGTRVTLGTNQSYLLNPSGSERIAGDLSIVQNNSKGKNNSYDKQIISLLYGFPAPLASSGSIKAEFATAGYKLNSNDRTDSIWTYTLGASRPFWEVWSLALNAQFINSKSSLETNKYDKSIVGFVISYSGSISKK